MADRGAVNAPTPTDYISVLKWGVGEQVYRIQHVYKPFYIQSLFEESQ